MSPSEPSSPRPAGILKQGAQECVSPSSYLGLSQGLSPQTTAKTVSIAPHAEVVSPLVLGRNKSVDDFRLENANPQRRVPVRGPSSRRLSGRPASALSPSLQPLTPNYFTDEAGQRLDSGQTKQIDQLIDHVAAWIKEQRQKHTRKKASSSQPDGRLPDDAESCQRTSSDACNIPLDLDRLETILKQARKPERPLTHRGSYRRRPSLKKLTGSSLSASSDTEYIDGDGVVPSSDAVLDNSKTVALNGGGASESDDSSSDELTRVPSYRDFDAWSRFKFEIVRLTHTLRLKGWRRVPMDMSGKISVQRLSGALTNAVYVVSPPRQLPELQQENDQHASGKRLPQKLLLRLYGPQVGHLIDRDAELQILRRLARKKIGPRMLGTFANGRFEEYFHAQPLTPQDFRNPDTSRQIAKRMRELHDGIELLEEERDSGAFVWRNWDKWVQRVERVVTWLDEQIDTLDPASKPTGDNGWKRRGYICGVKWKQFRQAVEKYRSWLESEYGGPAKINENLVFAHNDTQYGNILRIMPTGESPLLLPANTHKQLVVIDFEYANANLPGLEFANHFTEWCYNYHDKRKPYACNTSHYPLPDEQDRFIRAYVRHRPEFNVSTPKLTPANSMPALTSGGSTPVPKRSTTSSSISTFMLDARNPLNPSQPSKYDESAEKAAEDIEVKRLVREARIWRLANTAQWVAWGIVQAKAPGMPDFGSDPSTTANEEATPAEIAQHDALDEISQDYSAAVDTQQSQQQAAEEEQEEEFDYLGYARHRAMFFWGDAIQLGIVDADQLPEEVRSNVKTVPY